MFQTMSEGIVVFQKGLITFSNNAFKKIIQNIKFQDDEVEVDIFDYKLFKIYDKDEVSNDKSKNKNNKSHKPNELNKLAQTYSLNDILSYPEEFLKETIFKIIYDVNSDNSFNSISLHYVMLKVSKIKSSVANKK